MLSLLPVLTSVATRTSLGDERRLADLCSPAVLDGDVVGFDGAKAEWDAFLWL